MANSRPEAYAGCRACCEGIADLNKFNRTVDSVSHYGVKFRTVSGGKLSSTKIDFAGVIFFSGESIEGLFIYGFR